MPTKLLYSNMDFQRGGKSIVLPEDMSYGEAIEWLKRKIEAEEEIVFLSREYSCFPMDGAAATTRAIAAVYGWANAVPTPGFFGDTPPQFVNVAISHDTFISVCWGQMQIPDLGVVRTEFARSQAGLPVFRLTFKLRQKNRRKAEELFDAVQREVENGSIYRGKAVRFDFEGVDDSDDDFDPTVSPTFLDLTKHNPNEVVFPGPIENLIDVTLFAPLRHTDVLRREGIPLKRGVLLAGDYGVGKTLLAYKAAHVATENGWTYLYTSAKKLPEAIEFALLYEPCALFAEDLDSTVGNQNRDEATNELLNTLDGVNVKGREVMVVLTTNHLDKINQAMLRPGRLDAVIKIPAPDAAAAERLVRMYAREQLPEDEDITVVGRALAGKIPSAIREVVERTKLWVINRTGKADDPFTEDDLLQSLYGMEHHLELLKPREEDKRSDLEKAAQVLVDNQPTDRPESGNGRTSWPLGQAKPTPLLSSPVDGDSDDPYWPIA